MKPRAKKPTAREVRAEQTLRELEEALGALEVSVTYDRTLEGRGGMCLVRGARRIILNRGLPPSEKVELILEGLRALGIGPERLPESVREIAVTSSSPGEAR